MTRPYFKLLLLFLLLSLAPLGGSTILSDPTQAGSLVHYIPISFREDPPTWIGPDGGTVVAIAYDPQHPEKVYAGLWGGGVFKSQDGGATWQPASAGLGNLNINSLAVAPTNPDILFAGTYKFGIYKSTDGGLSWQASNQGVQASAIVYSIAVDPTDANRVYMSTRGQSNNGGPPWAGVVYRSVNGGASWSAALQNIGGTGQQDWVYSLAIAPRDPNFVLAAAHEYGPYRSTNYGVNWQAVSSGISDSSGRAVALDPRYASPNTAYLGVWHNSGVFKTTNDGNTWAQTANGITGKKIYCLAIDPSSPTTVYAGTGGTGVYRTTNGGASWGPAGLQTEFNYAVVINPQASTTLLSGTSGDGLFKTTTSGGSWFHSQRGLTNASVTGVLLFPGNYQNFLIATNGAGILNTPDGGTTWLDLNSGLPDKYIHALVINPAQPNLAFALTDTSGLYRIDISNPTGWSRITSGPLPTSRQPAFGPDHPFAGRDILVEPDLSQELSTEALPASAPLLAMSFSPSNPSIAYIGTSTAGVYKSTDSGITWSPAGLSGQIVWGVAVDPGNPNLLYAATNLPGSLKTSPDGGITWTDLSLPGLTVYSLSTSPALPGVLLAGTSSGVYRRDGEGSLVLTGLPGKTVTVVSTRQTRPGVIFASTTTGTFWSGDGGYTWNPGPEELNGFTVQSINFDPSSPYTVFFGTTTHGALRIYLH